MRLPPLEKDGRGGNFATGFARLSACRKADSTSSDMVCPRLAASRFTARIVASLIESVVFIWKTIRVIWLSVKRAARLAGCGAGGQAVPKNSFRPVEGVPRLGGSW